MSKIEWTGKTWNVATGCTKISAGCKNCYAHTMALRLQAMGQSKYRNGFEPTMHPELLTIPFKWKKPTLIFPVSMGDLFHDDITDEFIANCFEVMARTPRHLYQVLTKRPDRLLDCFFKGLIPKNDNIWLGVTVENQDNVKRIGKLMTASSAGLFLSCEPLLSELDLRAYLNYGDIGWVIVGGESGSKARPIQKEWVIDIQNQCSETNTPFFFKQWGGKNKKANGCLIEGKEIKEVPSIMTPFLKNKEVL